MGDVGDYWREHREYRQSQGLPANSGSSRRPATLVKFTKKHEKMGFRCFTIWHWQMSLAGSLLDYWPSKSKWRHGGVTRQGTFDQLKKFIASTTTPPADRKEISNV